MAEFLKALHSGRVLLMDGAMGTELLRAGGGLESGLETLSFTKPAKIVGLHRAYALAGARVFLTNTFQLFSGKYAATLRDHEVTSIGMAAVRLARLVAGPARFVFLDAGPHRAGQAANASSMIVMAAQDERVDAVLLETCTSVADAQPIFQTTFRRDLSESDLPLVMSWAFQRRPDRTLTTYANDSPAACAHFAAQAGAVALGVNCGTDIRLPELLEILAEYRSVTDLPLFVRPNAGTPKQIDGQWVYPETPESMAAWLPELFKAGVVMVGGCCGTTPAHIAAFRKVVDQWNASQSPRTAVRGLSQDPSS